MPMVHKTPAVTLTAKAIRELAADLLIIPIFEDDDLADSRELDRVTGGEYGRARSRGEFKGGTFEQLAVSIEKGTWRARRALFVGVGTRKEISPERLRRVAIVGGLAARQRRLTSVAVIAPPIAAVAPARVAQVLAEGVTLANYEGA